MQQISYTSYTPNKTPAKNTDSSNPVFNVFGGIVLLVIIGFIITVISDKITGARIRKTAEEHKKHEDELEAERKHREAEEEERKKREKLRKEEEFRQYQERENRRRKLAMVDFKIRKDEIDRKLEKKIVEVDEAYSNLYLFQKQALSDLFTPQKKFCILPTGAGKTAVMFNWLKYMGAKKVLIVTTASKRDSGDFEEEANIWCGAGWKESLDSFEVISWHGLNKWVNVNWSSLDKYVYAFDEIHNASAGVRSNMGKAFLKIARQTKNWSGYTATPGDEWKKFCAYFIATGKVWNATSFNREFVNMQFGQGYAYIAGYRNEEKLTNMWREISTAPDASSVFDELPEEIEKTIEFEKPSGYNSIIRTRTSTEGKQLESTMALCHALRQKCCTKQKLGWISDFVDGLETNAVFFYNYVEEGNQIVEVLKKKIPKDAKIWRIDGKNHNIPTRDSIGPHDMVVAQYTSGSNSLNLQFIHYWISFSPNYSYTLSLQAKGRIKRIGQKHSMFFYYFRTTNTIEDAIYDCLSKKKDFSEDIWAEEIGLNN